MVGGLSYSYLVITITMGSGQSVLPGKVEMSKQLMNIEQFKALSDYFDSRLQEAVKAREVSAINYGDPELRYDQLISVTDTDTTVVFK